jgi:TRAP-type mannitol/chloroaromatic compound transport system permease small subunit
MIRMAFLRTLLSILDAFAEKVGRFAAWFAGLMVFVTVWVVVARYVFNAGSIAVQDMIIYLNALVFTLGAAWTLKHNGHVRVDIFYGTARPRRKAWVDLLGTVLLLLPVAVFLLWACWDYVLASWAIREKSPDTGGLPFVFLLKSLMLALPVLLILQGIAEVLRNALLLLGPDSTAPRAAQPADGTVL